ncbi:MAG: hypothetical protein PHO76_07805 [Methylotenera sp.]|nr:hypothetical protein [Methylotenera sp.]MDD4924913.1 hypothetical protein [Methylotenera sp.]
MDLAVNVFKVKLLREISTLMIAITLLCGLSVSASAASDSRKTEIKTRAGVVVVNQSSDGLGATTISLNNKQIYKNSMDDCNCYISITGAYVFGDNDIIAVREGFAGNAVEMVRMEYYLINKNGAISNPKVLDTKGKPSGIECEGELSDPVVKGSKLITSCAEKDGRRTKTFIWTYENGIVKQTR